MCRIGSRPHPRPRMPGGLQAPAAPPPIRRELCPHQVAAPASNPRDRRIGRGRRGLPPEAEDRGRGSARGGARSESSAGAGHGPAPHRRRADAGGRLRRHPHLPRDRRHGPRRDLRRDLESERRPPVAGPDAPRAPPREPGRRHLHLRRGRSRDLGAQAGPDPARVGHRAAEGDGRRAAGPRTVVRTDLVSLPEAIPNGHIAWDAPAGFGQGIVSPSVVREDTASKQAASPPSRRRHLPLGLLAGRRPAGPGRRGRSRAKTRTAKGTPRRRSSPPLRRASSAATSSRSATPPKDGGLDFQLEARKGEEGAFPDPQKEQGKRTRAHGTKHVGDERRVHRRGARRGAD